MNRRKAVMSWSSGKDSAFALAAARAAGELDIVALVSSVNEEFERVAIHGTRRVLAAAQAAALGLELIEVSLPQPCTNEIYEARMTALACELQEKGINDWVFGDLFLEDVVAYRQALFGPLGIELHLPLWQRDTTALAADMLDAGLQAFIVTLDPKKLPKDLCGAAYDHNFLAALPDSVDPCGEKGEFHTIVANAPGFASPLQLEKGIIVERSGFVYCDFILKDGQGAGRDA